MEFIATKHHSSMNIDLSFPCNEDRNKMTDTDKGKFCAQCSKEVIDFTTWEKEDIIAYLSKQKSCGIFKKGQLDTIKSKPIEQPVFIPQLTLLKRAAASVALLSVALFSCADGDVNAQTKESDGSKETKQIKNCQPKLMGKVDVKHIEIIDTTEIEMGEAAPMPDDSLLMGDIYIEPAPPSNEPPVMGIPAVNHKDEENIKGQAIKKEEE